MKAQIEKLLILQDKDARLASIKNALSEIPHKLSAVKSEIAAANKNLADAHANLKETEQKRENMRTERRTMEAKVIKYKTQLPETKKNEDYVALNKEIEKFGKIASDMEEDELGLMFEIDETKKRLKESEVAHAEEILRLNKKIELIGAEKNELEGRLANAEAESEQARKEIDPAYLSSYDRLKSGNKKYPIAVPLKGEQCGGCFLKASGETLSKIKVSDSPVLCEQCGRILYVES